MINRNRSALAGVALAASTMLAGCAGVTGSAPGDNFPSGTIELVVPFSAGGATDLIGRAFAAELEKNLENTTIVVVNKPGSNTAVAATGVAGAKPDGYTLFLGTSTTFVTTPMTQSVPYTPEDFEGIAGIADQPYMLVTANDSEYVTLEDLKNAEGRVTYGVTAMGSNTHLAVADLLAKWDVKAEAIPFESAQEVVTAAAGGQVDIAAADFNIAAPQVKGGSVKGLAVTSAVPVPQAPDLPTLLDSGVDTQPFVGRFALVAPDGLPEDVRKTLVEAAESARKSERFQTFVAANGLVEPEYKDGREWIERMVPELRASMEHLFDELNISK
jgi:tripartite-type tricarboxylate transporter receptor subunit TctC